MHASQALETVSDTLRGMASMMDLSDSLKFSRRTALAGLGLGGYLFLSSSSQGKETSLTRKRVPLIVATDLFRPHDDPDDHWDLATAYALAFQGAVDLQAVLIDFPRPNSGKDPDVLAVCQMNYITGLKVPVIVGSPHPYTPDIGFDKDEATRRRLHTLLEVLEGSKKPVGISVAGSCRDIATAARLRPDLFAEKCAAVYLNAGASRPDASGKSHLEWNVTLDPAAYRAMFELPCPVYWMPCFEDVRRVQVSEYATYFRFQQGDVLSQVSPLVRKFFGYVFHAGATGQKPSTDWLQYLLAEEDQTLLSAIAQQPRNMWCTGGFIHAAGFKVTPEGELVALDDKKPSVFEFAPIEIRRCEGGFVEWEPSDSEKRFIFHVTNVDRYNSAMTNALLTLLRGLP